MTYCLGIRTQDGLVALADGRVTSGNQMHSAHKVVMLGGERHRYFIMTSGLRSVRDKVLAYYKRDGEAAKDERFPTLLDAVTSFGKCIRDAAQEDMETLTAAGLKFNTHALIGGRLAGDTEPTIFLVYPEGNWIEVDQRTPYLSIGTTAYGKPILDRALKYDTPLRQALKLAYLSFDSSRFSSTDVGFPIDVITYANGDAQWRQAQFDYDELIEQRQWWNREITALAARVPDRPWVDTLLPPGQLQLSVVGDEGK